MSTAARIVAALLLVGLNGFFVAVEFGIARLRRTQAEELAHEGRPGSKAVLHAVDHIDSYLSACQLGITICSLGLGALGEPAFHDLLEPILGDAAEIAGIGLASALSFAIITTLHVVVGELAPKSAAIARTSPIVLALTPPMRLFYLVTKPVVDGLNGLGNLVLKPFGVPPKDLLPVGVRGEAHVDLRSIARPIAHVSESSRVDRVLREMRRERRHLALVHDEHGTVVGLITLEDILEEIVGETEDEFDPERQDAIRVDGDTILIDGAAPAREVAGRLGFELEGHHETTIGGYLSEELGRVPRPGEEVALHERRFKVLGVDGTLVTELALVDRRDGSDASGVGS